jgi:hypothetical protein
MARKTAQKGVAKRAEPESKRRYLIINEETGQPTLGSLSSVTSGISLESRARRISDGLAVSSSVVLYHEWLDLPDPDLEYCDDCGAGFAPEKFADHECVGAA